MPNWCSNHIAINGDVETIKEIKRILTKPFIKPDSSADLIKRRDEVLQNTSPEDVGRILNEYNSKIEHLKMQESRCLTAGEPGVFKKLVGIAPDISLAEYNNQGWYNANVDYWGTKWDIDFDEDMWNLDDDDYMSANFDTAWSPPEGFCKALFLKYPGLTEIELTYEECGCDFAGKLTLLRDVDGEMFANEVTYSYEEGIYRLDPDHFWCRLDDEMEYIVENETTLEEIKQRFAFVTDNELNEIIELYENAVINSKQEEDAD